MRKILTLSVFILFLAAVLLFSLCGAGLREFFSPDVVCEKIEYRSFSEDDPRAYPSFPNEAVCEDEEGKYVWIIEANDELPEKAYVARRHGISVIYENERYAYVSGTLLGSVVIKSDGELTDGCCVKIS